MKTEIETDMVDEQIPENPKENEPQDGVKKKHPLLFIVPGIIALLVVGFFVVKAFGSKGKDATPVTEEAPVEEILKEVDASVQVNLTRSTSKDNTVVITVTGLAGRYVSIGYELQYESGGVGKGVTSGSKPLDVTGEDMFEREIYLGTCSKNVCKPDLGVTKVGLVLEFTDTATTRTQFSKEFEL